MENLEFLFSCPLKCPSVQGFRFNEACDGKIFNRIMINRIEQEVFLFLFFTPVVCKLEKRMILFKF